MINFREMEKKKKFGILFIMGALVVVVLPTVASASKFLEIYLKSITRV